MAMSILMDLSIASFIGNHINFQVRLLFEDPLALYGFYPFGWINQSPYLVCIHGVHL